MAIISVNKGDWYYNFDRPQLANGIFETHSHKNYELLYFIGGRASYIVEGNEYSAAPGDLFITRPDELHSIILKSPGKYARHFFQFSPAFLAGLYGGYDLLRVQQARAAGCANHIPAALVAKHRLGDFFDRVQDEATALRSESGVLIQSYTVQQLLQINRLTAFPQPTADGKDAAQEGSDAAEKIRRIKDCIKRHATENVSLDALAGEVFMSKYYLCRFFKQYTGVSPKQYADIMRIHCARALLAQGKPLADVCEQCGFSDYSSFYRMFVKISGIPPRSFARQMVGAESH